MKFFLSALLFVAASTLYAQNAEGICALNIGSEVPSATITSIEGKQQDIKDVIGKDATVLIFCRGGWCPYCNKHLEEIQHIEADIIAKGYTIIALSADKHDMLSQTTDKNELGYRLYSDNALNASDAFGITFTPKKSTISMYNTALAFEKWAGEGQERLPVPAVFIIRKGEIVYRYVNPDYKQRLSAEMLLAALNSLD